MPSPCSRLSPFRFRFRSFRCLVTFRLSAVRSGTFLFRPKGLSVSVLCCSPFVRPVTLQGRTGNEATGFGLFRFGADTWQGEGRGAIPTSLSGVTLRGAYIPHFVFSYHLQGPTFRHFVVSQTLLGGGPTFPTSLSHCPKGPTCRSCVTFIPASCRSFRA